MATLLQIAAGIVLAFAAIIGVFWFSFRNPPEIRKNRSLQNSDVDLAMRSWSDDGHGGLS